MRKQTHASTTWLVASLPLRVLGSIPAPTRPSPIHPPMDTYYFDCDLEAQASISTRTEPSPARGGGRSKKKVRRRKEGALDSRDPLPACLPAWWVGGWDKYGS